MHLIRYAMQFAFWKKHKAVTAALKPIYQALDLATARAALEAFDERSWSRKYLVIAQSWRRT